MNKEYEEQLERAMRCRKTHPWLLLRRGPSIQPCSVHGKNENLVLQVDDIYWRDNPMCEAPDCKCSVRAMSNREYERVLAGGVQDSSAPPILDDNGRNTGHRIKRMVPVKQSLTI